MCHNVWSFTGVFAAAVLCVGPLQAQDDNEFIAIGCYERVYSQSHMQSQPDQVVKEMRLNLMATTGVSDRMASMEVLAANQGHAKRNGNGGKTFDQYFFCGEAYGLPQGCGVECDGGTFEFVRESENEVVIRTGALMVGEIDGCGGAMDVVEKPGVPVSYKLFRVPDHHCASISQR